MVKLDTHFLQWLTRNELLVEIQWVLAGLHLPGSTIVITACWHSFQWFLKGYQDLSTHRDWIILYPWVYSLPLVLAKGFWKIFLWTSVAGVGRRKTEGNNQDWVATTEEEISELVGSSGRQWGISAFNAKITFTLTQLLPVQCRYCNRLSISKCSEFHYLLTSKLTSRRLQKN